MRSVILQFQLGEAVVPSVPAEAPEQLLLTEKAPVVEGYVCPHCQSSFSSERGRKTHVRQVHELKKYSDWRPNR